MQDPTHLLLHAAALLLQLVPLSLQHRPPLLQPAQQALGAPQLGVQLGAAVAAGCVLCLEPAGLGTGLSQLLLRGPKLALQDLRQCDMQRCVT